MVCVTVSICRSSTITLGRSAPSLVQVAPSSPLVQTPEPHPTQIVGEGVRQSTARHLAATPAGSVPVRLVQLTPLLVVRAMRTPLPLAKETYTVEGLDGLITMSLT